MFPALRYANIAKATHPQQRRLQLRFAPYVGTIVFLLMISAAAEKDISNLSSLQVIMYLIGY